MTAQRQTVPAAFLDALGYLKGDPPVEPILAGGLRGCPVAVRQWAGWFSQQSDATLLVEESAPALLRALARSYGAKLQPGEVPGWGVLGGRWYLTWRAGLDPIQRIFQPPGSPPHGLPSRYGDYQDVPAIVAGMGRLEALAAVIAWKVGQ